MDNSEIVLLVESFTITVVILVAMWTLRYRNHYGTGVKLISAGITAYTILRLVFIDTNIPAWHMVIDDAFIIAAALINASCWRS